MVLQSLLEHVQLLVHRLEQLARSEVVEVVEERLPRLRQLVPDERGGVEVLDLVEQLLRLSLDRLHQRNRASLDELLEPVDERVIDRLQVRGEHGHGGGERSLERAGQRCAVNRLQRQLDRLDVLDHLVGDRLERHLLQRVVHRLGLPP